MVMDVTLVERKIERLSKINTFLYIILSTYIFTNDIGNLMMMIIDCSITINGDIVAIDVVSLSEIQGSIYFRSTK